MPEFLFYGMAVELSKKICNGREIWPFFQHNLNSPTSGKEELVKLRDWTQVLENTIMNSLWCKALLLKFYRDKKKKV